MSSSKIVFKSGVFDLDKKEYIHKIEPEIFGDIYDLDDVDGYINMMMQHIQDCVPDWENFLNDVANIMLRNKPIKICLYECDKSIECLIWDLKDIVAHRCTNNYDKPHQWDYQPILISDSLPVDQQYKVYMCKKATHANKRMFTNISDPLRDVFLTILVNRCEAAAAAPEPAAPTPLDKDVIDACQAKIAKMWPNVRLH
jgi:hypothetical protein